MSHLKAVNKYFIKYKWRLLMGLIFVAISNLFAVIPPVIIRNVLDNMQDNIQSFRLMDDMSISGSMKDYLIQTVFWNGLILLCLALLRGIFMFFMRQTIIVMSRLIEYDQKNEIYAQYQRLHTHFFKVNFTGDLMNRISEDVGRVRMYTGPSIMYFTNMLVITGMSIYGMLKVNALLTLWVVLPLPFLAFSIYIINRKIFKKSTHIQSQLSSLTTTAQESYSGIRVIKSFGQEPNMMDHFNKTSEEYRDSAINLSLTEALYFPSMNLFIGLSMLSTILIGGYFAIQGSISTGNIAEFVIYINLLIFPISSIGMVASMTQRASASQKRINEFLDIEPEITNDPHAQKVDLKGNIDIDEVTFTYPHTGITALKNLSLHIKAGQKIAIIGKTGSGKSTFAHLLLRMYEPQLGTIKLENTALHQLDMQHFRKQIAYAPQDAFLFSDTIANNIKFGKQDATHAQIIHAAQMADLDVDIVAMPNGYETMIGERGVTLSGGQKQRMILARAILKDAPILLLDECLSAVDTQTEKNIINNLKTYLDKKTTILITHRIFTTWEFDAIYILDQGHIVEKGTHEELIQLGGHYAAIWEHQIA